MFGTVFLFALAMAYLRLGLFIPLEFSDEGMIVYGIWRVSEGELPYRDFHQIYAPSTFFLGGALFRLFGPDLLVLRYLVLAVKAAICVMVYFGARRLSGRSVSLLVYAVAVVLLGVSWPIVTTPYPNFFATALCLVGVLLFLGLERRVLWGCVLAGLCLGMAATFKQTTGAFAFLAIALSLLTEERRGETLPGPALLLVVRASRWFVLVFSASLVVLYLAPRNPWWNFALLSAPSLFLVAWLVRREFRAPPGPAHQLVAFERLLALTVSFLVPLVGYGIAYASLGLGDEILHDVFTGLPAVTSWMVPYSPPNATFLLWQVAVGGAVASVWLGRRADPARAAWSARLSIVVSVVAMAALLVQTWPARPEHSWFWMSSDLLRSVPFWLVWLSIIGMLGQGTEERGASKAAPTRALVVFTLYGAMALLWLYPAADIWHVFAILPSCLPLLAHLLQSQGERPERAVPYPPADRLASAMVIGVLGLALTLPAALDLVRALRKGRAFDESIPRATGVRGAPGLYSPNGRDADVVRYLRATDRSDDPVFVLSGKPLFYFLTDRVSPVQELEFVLYSVANGVMAADQGRAFAGDRLVREIERTRPLIIDDDWDDRAQNMRRSYPRLDRLLRRHYRVEKTFGRYRVLRWQAPTDEDPVVRMNRHPGVEGATTEGATSVSEWPWLG